MLTDQQKIDALVAALRGLEQAGMFDITRPIIADRAVINARAALAAAEKE